MQKTSLIKSVLLAGLVTLSNLAVAEIVVIVNPKSPMASMRPDQVSAIFMGKTGMLPSGASAMPVDLPEGNTVRDEFYKKSSGKLPSQVKATWVRLTFSGKAMPPKEMGSSAEVKKFVASTADAIGYIEKSALDGTVKAVLSLD